MKKYTLTTTLDLLREHHACTDGYRKLVKSLGSGWPHDKPINLLRVLKSNGVLDMCWCFRATREDSTIPRVLIAADFAQSVLKHFTAKYPNDSRPAKAIQAARDFAAGRIDRAAAASASAADAAAAAYAAYAAAAAAAAAAASASAADAAAAAYAADAAADAAAAAYAADAAAAASAADAAAAAYAAYAADAAAARKKETAKQARIIRKYLK